MRLIFYKLYKWALKYDFWGSPQYSALLFMSLFIFLNLSTLFVFIKIILGGSPKLYVFNKSVYIGLFILIAGIVYFLFLQGNKIVKLISYYKNRKAFKENRANAITVAYILLTLFTFLSLGFFKVN